MRRIVFFLLPAISFLIACGEDRLLEYADRVEANEWIYATMERNYFYASFMSSPEKRWYASPENFFQDIRSGNEVRGGTYLSQLFFGTELSQAPSYGYLFDYYSFDSLNCLRVIYVAPQSPASEAGVRRGDWITGFDGKKIGDRNYTELSQSDGGSHRLVIGKQVGFSERNQPIIEDEKELNISAPRILTASPVEKDTILDWCDRKVGYLMYTRFESAPDGENSMNGIYNEDLRRACSNFSAKGVKEIVLDLRYSTGSAFYCTQLLGTMLVPRLSLGDCFFHIKYSDGMLTPYYFESSDIGTGANLDFSSLYVIASSRTMGAAELLMHSLSPYMKVVIIGGRTTGHDLLAETFPSDIYGLRLKLATRIMLDKDLNTYSGGVTPDVVISEKDSLRYLVHDFGDPQELLLHSALRVMSDSISVQEPSVEVEEFQSPVNP